MASTTTPHTLIYADRVSGSFARAVIVMANRLGIEPNWIMACMAFETGLTFSPSVRNPRSSATGLIQFMAFTAKALGTTCTALSRMTAVEQLAYVEKYFARIVRRRPIHTLEDTYMAILWPKAIGKGRDYVLWSKATGAAYRVNAGLDLNRDGSVTVAEATTRVRRLYEAGLKALPSA